MPRQTKPETPDDVHHDAPAVQVLAQPSHLSQEVLVLHATPVLGIAAGLDDLFHQVFRKVVLGPDSPTALSTFQCPVTEEQLRCQHRMTSHDGSQCRMQARTTRQAEH
jgi:hypothetical protein